MSQHHPKHRCSAIRQTREVFWITAALFAFTLAGTGTEAARYLTGTLTCTSAPLRSHDGTADASLACSFQGEAGRHYHLAGTALSKNGSKILPGKHVFIWSVHSRGRIKSGKDLVGRYLARLGDWSASILAKKEDGFVILKPVLGSSRLGQNSSFLAVELTLKPMQV
jgi:hypothetical protein